MQSSQLAWVPEHWVGVASRCVLRVKSVARCGETHSGNNQISFEFWYDDMLTEGNLTVIMVFDESSGEEGA